jgi:phosphonoacetaldehyde hydrolase
VDAPQSTEHRLKAVVLDWAGTTVDFGCFSPVDAFRRLFESFGVPITVEEARNGMGKFKRDHIRHILSLPSVSQRWQAQTAQLPNDSDVDALFTAFIPHQQEAIKAYTTLIPGVLEAVTAYRDIGLKIGSCTGYTREMMDVLIEDAAAQGYFPNAIVCPDEVRAGRPAPWMLYRNAELLDVYPQSAMVKIGDTVVDIEEGLNAGMWTIGLTRTGNEVGLSETEITVLSEADLHYRLGAAAVRLMSAGAHYIADSLADTPKILEEINERLQAGDKP